MVPSFVLVDKSVVRTSSASSGKDLRMCFTSNTLNLDASAGTPHRSNGAPRERAGFKKRRVRAQRLVAGLCRVAWTTAFDHVVPVQQRAFVALQQTHHVGLVAVFDKVRLGEHANRTQAVWVDSSGARHNVLSRHVTMAFEDREDERSFLLEVRIHQLADLAHHRL